MPSSLNSFTSPQGAHYRTPNRETTGDSVASALKYNFRNDDSAIATADDVIEVNVEQMERNKGLIIQFVQDVKYKDEL
eukprot:15334004-Ditylum_brightwellii.AAC.1